MVASLWWSVAVGRDAVEAARLAWQAAGAAAPVVHWRHEPNRVVAVCRGPAPGASRAGTSGRLGRDRRQRPGAHAAGGAGRQRGTGRLDRRADRGVVGVEPTGHGKARAAGPCVVAAAPAGRVAFAAGGSTVRLSAQAGPWSARHRTVRVPR